MICVGAEDLYDTLNKSRVEWIYATPDQLAGNFIIPADIFKREKGIDFRELEKHNIYCRVHYMRTHVIVFRKNGLIRTLLNKYFGIPGKSWRVPVEYDRPYKGKLVPKPVVFGGAFQKEIHPDRTIYQFCHKISEKWVVNKVISCGVHIHI